MPAQSDATSLASWLVLLDSQPTRFHRPQPAVPTFNKKGHKSNTNGVGATNISIGEAKTPGINSNGLIDMFFEKNIHNPQCFTILR